MKVTATTVTIIKRSVPLVLGHPTSVYVLHEAGLILKQHAAKTWSLQRPCHSELTILNGDYMTLKRCSVLNPATSLAVPSDGELHGNCTVSVSLKLHVK